MEKNNKELLIGIIAGISTSMTITPSVNIVWEGSVGVPISKSSDEGYADLGAIVASAISIGTAVDASSGPDIIVETKDSNDYEKVEARAQRIYDKFNKNHNTDYKPAVLIANTPEQAKALTEIFDMFDSEENLYIFLTALQAVLEEMVEEEQKEKVKTKKLEK